MLNSGKSRIKLFTVSNFIITKTLNVLQNAIKNKKFKLFAYLPIK